MLCFCDYRTVFSVNWDSNDADWGKIADAQAIYAEHKPRIARHVGVNVT